jgi:hypothetical protein
MPNFFARYTAATAEFDKVKALYPATALAGMKKGILFGTALKAFDKAATFELRAKVMAAVRTSEQVYDQQIRLLMATVKKQGKQDSPAYKALVKLQTSMNEILAAAQDEAQPPKPGGGTVPYEVLRSFNLGNGFKPKYLSLEATKVDVTIAIDKTLDALIKSGEESLKINYLGDVAKEEVTKLGDAFSATMKDIDGKLEGLDAKGRETKVKEANEVLKHYAKIVQSNVNTAVMKEWQAYLDRKKYLKDFRFECIAKVALGAVGVGVAVASMALTFGALWQSVFGLVKAVLSIADTLKTWSQNIDQVYELLVKDIDAITDLNTQRELAKEKGQSQKGSKAKEAGKEVLVSLLPITKNMVRSATTVQGRAKQLLGLVSKLETGADKLTGTLNQAVAAMSKLPEKQMNAAMKADAEKMKETFEKLFGEISDLHARSQKLAKFGDRALAQAQKLLKEDSWTAPASEKTNLGSRAFTMYSLANFAFELGKHGTSLISLL